MISGDMERGGQHPCSNFLTEQSLGTASWVGLQHFGLSSPAAPALAGEVVAPDCCPRVIPGTLQSMAHTRLLLQPLIL